MSSSLGETEARRRRCFHDVDANEEGGSDCFLGHALVAHGLKRSELIEGMQRRTVDVLRERNLVDQDVARRIADDTGHGRCLGETLLPDEQLKRTIAPTASRYLKHAGLLALGVKNGTNMQGLDETAPGDGLGQLLDRDTGLDAPDVRLAEH